MKLRRRASRRSVGNKRSNDSEAAVINAATSILLDVGLDGFSIESVAKQARSGKPTIYKWWGSKRSLAYDAYSRSVPVRVDDVEAAPTVDKINAFYGELWKVWSAPECAQLSRQFLADALQSSDTIKTYRDDYFAKRLEPLLVLIRSGMDRGDLPPSLDVQLVVDLLSGFHILRFILDRPPSPGDIQAALQAVLSGVGDP
jgi:AcrR family transcriptional regulator